MPSTDASLSLRKSIRQIWQRIVQTRIWKMDIHPTAWIATTALIDRTWPRGIHIGAGCVIDHQSVVLTHDMTRGLYLDTRIEQGARIGARAIILPGITLGRDCVVEPGAVVNRSVPAGARVRGNPAREVE